MLVKGYKFRKIASFNFKFIAISFKNDPFYRKFSKTLLTISEDVL